MTDRQKQLLKEVQHNYHSMSLGEWIQYINGLSQEHRDLFNHLAVNETLGLVDRFEDRGWDFEDWDTHVEEQD